MRVQPKEGGKEDELILGVDTGNKMIKTDHFIFHSGIKVKEQRILNGEEGICYKGVNYIENSQRITYLQDKTADERYYILTLLGIAKELEREEGNVRTKGIIPITLLVGLPPGDYGRQKRRFQEYFYRQGKTVHFLYKNRSYQITYTDVKVYMQAYSAYLLIANRLRLVEYSKVLIIDIGGFTVDYLMVRYGVVQPTQIDSIPEGIITLYKRINAGIRQHFNLLLDETDIDNILFKRNTQYPEKVLRRTFEIAKDYLVELLGTFLELGIDIRTTVTVFVGGGSILLTDLIEDVWVRYNSQYFIVDDPQANVKGFKKQYLAELADSAET